MTSLSAKRMEPLYTHSPRFLCESLHIWAHLQLNHEHVLHVRIGWSGVGGGGRAGTSRAWCRTNYDGSFLNAAHCVWGSPSLRRSTHRATQTVRRTTETTADVRVSLGSFMSCVYALLWPDRKQTFILTKYIGWSVVCCGFEQYWHFPAILENHD